MSVKKRATLVFLMSLVIWWQGKTSVCFVPELIDFSIRTGAPLEVVENLQSMEDEGDIYESIEEIWPDFPSEEDYLWNEDEY